MGRLIDLAKCHTGHRPTLWPTVETRKIIGICADKYKLLGAVCHYIAREPTPAGNWPRQ